MRAFRPHIAVTVALIAMAIALHAGATFSVPPNQQTILIQQPDVLRDSVQAGEVFITALPWENGQNVEYELLRGPALSWLVGRSFFWDTRPEDAGEHRILFRSITEAQTDTLVLSLTVMP